MERAEGALQQDWQELCTMELADTEGRPQVGELRLYLRSGHIIPIGSWKVSTCREGEYPPVCYACVLIRAGMTSLSFISFA